MREIRVEGDLGGHVYFRARNVEAPQHNAKLEHAESA